MGENYKTMINMGWDFSEKKMLQKLSNYAKEGWILKSMDATKFIMERGKPRDIIYAMDYQPKVDDIKEYTQLFYCAGWTLVCEIAGFRIFAAPIGTKPIYTDRSYLIESKKDRTKKVILSLLLSLVGICIGIMLENFQSNQITQIFGSIILLIASAFFGMCFVWSLGLLLRKDK